MSGGLAGTSTESSSGSGRGIEVTVARADSKSVDKGGRDFAAVPGFVPSELLPRQWQSCAEDYKRSTCAASFSPVL
jgi:hypothetical protein